MNKPVPFGRRGVVTPAARKTAAAASLDAELTPEMRALLFEDADGFAPAAEDKANGDLAPPWRRGIGFVVSLAVACAVAGFTLVGRRHQALEPLNAIAAALDPDSRALLAPVASWFGPAELAKSIVVISSDLGLALWLTQKIAAVSGIRQLSSVALLGAGLNLALAFVTSALGLGDGEAGLAVVALSGGGAAVFYRLLAGRRVA